MIEFINLNKKFGKITALDDISLRISENEICSILGPNGSGKTTLIKALLGMVNPNSGNILFDGQEIKGKADYRKNISYLPQIAHFPANITGYNLTKMMKDLRGSKCNESYYVDIFDLEAHLSNKLGHLSGGTVQKLNITLAMMSDSPVIVLDEPSNGLDPIALQNLKHIIRQEKEKGKIIILISHIMGLVSELSDRIVFMNNGLIKFDGTLNQIYTTYNSDNLEEAIANLLKEKNAKNISI